MFVRIYVCIMYICMYVRKCVGMYVRKNVCMYVCVCVCMYVCVFVYVFYVCMCVYVCMHVYTCVCIICMYICMYVCTYTVPADITIVTSCVKLQTTFKKFYNPIKGKHNELLDHKTE